MKTKKQISVMAVIFTFVFLISFFGAKASEVLSEKYAVTFAEVEAEIK